MPYFYFHLSAPDQFFPDKIGSNVPDLAAAHMRAVQLIDRVSMFGAMADASPDLQRWTVRVVDENYRPVITVIFPTNFAMVKPSPTQEFNGIRKLLRRYNMLYASEGIAMGNEFVEVARKSVEVARKSARDRSQ